MKEKKEFNELNERMRMRELEVEARKPKVIAWGERKHVTKIGSTGVMFWLIVSNRDKSLMRFCGAGTRKEERTRRQLKGLKKGEAVEIAQTGFGPWIA